MKTGLATLIGLSFSLVSCSVPIREGQVYWKGQEPERRWVVEVPAKRARELHNIPPAYLYLKDDEDYAIMIRKNRKTRKFYLSEEKYKEIKFGDWFKYDGKNARTEDYPKIEDCDLEWKVPDP